ncbi:Unspecific monooxygenase protein [Dioscorea alata]|uniref:Unspecific monooxygenase protein n=1 Tax=Dioscorea alata TaxID=55571 RepID=A0ACB7WM32_DIOAL|nr:Unspecific monooxygenase protein [Dioscorea alata]
MAQLRYIRLGRRWRRMRGFRWHSHRRTSHRRLHVKLLSFLRILTGCLKPLKGGYQRSLSRQEETIRYYNSTNSFYAEAIADCLEFIKRSSLPVIPEDGDAQTHQC